MKITLQATMTDVLRPTEGKLTYSLITLRMSARSKATKITDKTIFLISLRKLRRQTNSIPDFTQGELRDNLKTMRPRTKQYHPLLKNFGSNAFKFLLYMFIISSKC